MSIIVGKAGHYFYVIQDNDFNLRNLLSIYIISFTGLFMNV